MTNVTIKVEGMSCGHCVNSIEETLQQIGVSGKVDLKRKTVEVSFDSSKVTLDKVKEAIEEQGYDVL